MELSEKLAVKSGQVERYLEQPGTLPEKIRKRFESALEDDVVLYAFCDLNERFSLIQGWLILGRKYLALVHQGSETCQIQSVDLSKVDTVVETIGLSCHRLAFYAESASESLLTVRYTHRQQRSFALIKFVVEQKSDVNTDAQSAYTETVFESIADAQNSISDNRLAVIWRLLEYLRPYKTEVAIGMLAAGLMTLVSLIPAYLTGILIDNVIQPVQHGQINVDQAMVLAGYTVAGLIATYLFREFFAWIRLKKMAILGEYVARNLRTDVYAHLHKLSMSFFGEKQTGSLISRVGADTDRIWDFIAFGVVEVSTSVLLLTGLGAVLLSLDPILGLIVTVPVPLILYAIYRHGDQMQQLFLRAWRKWSNLTDVLSDTIPGIKVVKAFNRQEHETVRFNQRNEAVTDEFNRIHQKWTSFWPVLMLSIQFLIVLVWSIGLPRVLGVESVAWLGPLSAGTFVSFILYMTMFVQPIEIIGQMARMVNRATSSAFRVFEVLDTEPQVLDPRSAIKIDEVKGHVRFEHVGFSYDGVRQILKGISFEVQPGEMIGLVGPSGSGKTTTINLLARFFDVSSGRILVDGYDLREIDQGNYRTQVGMVLQDPYLFHGTILENIRYAKPDADFTEVIVASRAANAHDFICKLSNGYETMVGERGHTLSGGERQRVSIARAILRNPRILILDEATSAVDTETERHIQEALDRLTKGRTVIAIAHRLSTLAKADRLIILKDGKIAEEGTHEKLLQIKDGVYSRLCQMQTELQSPNLLH